MVGDDRGGGLGGGANESEWEELESAGPRVFRAVARTSCVEITCEVGYRAGVGRFGTAEMTMG